MSSRVYLLNGPNLDLLGEREPHLYGHHSLADVETLCRSTAERLGLEMVCHQTNAEHEMIGWLHEARGAGGIVINPAAFCYHSVPILDALRLCECPIVEVHMSNIHAREPFRHHSLLARIAKGQIAGFGVDSYLLGLRAVVSQLGA